MTKLQIKVLSYCLKKRRTFAQIARHCNVTVETLRTQVLDPELQALIDAGDTDGHIEDFTAQANNAGISFVENRRKDNRRYRVPLAISILALLTAIASTGISIYSLLK